MVICLFGTRYRTGYDVDMEKALGAVLLKALNRIDGFISFHLYDAADGEVLGVVRFDTREALEAWRNDPTHRSAWKYAPALYKEFWIQNAETYRGYVWAAEAGRTGEDVRARFRSESTNLAQSSGT